MIWILLILGLYILILFVVAWVSLHPFRTPLFISPGAMGQPQESVEIMTQDGIKLGGWLTELRDCPCVAILAHGYMMNRCELTPLAVRLNQEGCSTLLFDFRAHGKSGGRKSGLGWTEKADIRAVAGYVHRRFPKAKLVLIGSSMGAASAALALGDEPELADALILDSAYSRLPLAISGWWRFLGGKALSFLLTPSVVVAAPLAGFNPFKIDVSQSLSKLSIPVLVLHGDADNLATPLEAIRNEKACGGPVEAVWFAGCGHSEGRWADPEKYYSATLSFLRKHGLLERQNVGLKS